MHGIGRKIGAIADWNAPFLFFYNHLANTLILGGRLIFKWSLASVYKIRVLSHFRFAQRIHPSTVYREHFHENM